MFCQYIPGLLNRIEELTVEIDTLHVQAQQLIEEKNIAQQVADETVQEYTDVLEETLVLRKVCNQ